MLLRLCTLALFLAATPSTLAAATCKVSEEERAIASKLDWETFDQTGGVPGSFRELVKRDCYTEAVEAYREWLRHHKAFPDGRSEGIGFFHIGQALAFTGNREGAVQMIERSFRDEEAEGQSAVDWNAYVRGVLGYFAGNIDQIDVAVSQLNQSRLPFARSRVTVLLGLRNCIRLTYRQAMAGKCRSGS